MKQHPYSRMVAPRRGTVLCLLVLFVSCAMMGGADPVAQVDAARAAKEQLEDASAGAPASAAPAEIDYVDFAEAGAEAAVQMQTRTVNGAERITVSLDDVSLEDTVRLFAQTAGANIIASGAVMGGMRVTVNLKDVDWQPALRSILEIHNLSLVERVAGSGVFSIVAKAPDAPDPTVVETFFLDFTTVGEIQHSITGMLRPSSVLTTFPSRNAIVIRSTEENLREVGALIKALDRPGRQVLIEAKIMELSDGAMKQLGIRWDSLKQFGVSANIKPFEWSQTSTDTRTTERYSERLNQAHQVDTTRSFRPQESDITYASVGNRDYVSSENNDFIGETDPIAESGADAYTPGRERFAYGSTAAQTGESVVDKFTRDIMQSQSAILEMSSLSVILSALETMDGVSVVSNPKMIVSSGSRDAFFRVGRRDPIIESELKRGTAESPGDTITSKLMDPLVKTDLIDGGYFRTGIDLSVIATVKTDDYIEALISPSLRRLLEFKEVGINSWPVISVKEISTTFTLRSGQTVAIGGLTDTQDKKVTTRVPFLGRIPIIGRLFSHEEDVKSQVETIIFVTLSVADPGELEEDAGVPENASLVHQRRLQDKVRLEEQARKLQEQVAAAAATNAAPAVTVIEEGGTAPAGAATAEPGAGKKPAKGKAAAKK